MSTNHLPRGRSMSIDRINAKIEQMKGEIVRLEEKRALVASPQYKAMKEQKQMKAIESFAKDAGKLKLLLRMMPKDVLRGLIGRSK